MKWIACVCVQMKHVSCTFYTRQTSRMIKETQPSITTKNNAKEISLAQEVSKTNNFHRYISDLIYKVDVVPFLFHFFHLRLFCLISFNFFFHGKTNEINSLVSLVFDRWPFAFNAPLHNVNWFYNWLDRKLCLHDRPTPFVKSSFMMNSLRIAGFHFLRWNFGSVSFG